MKNRKEIAREINEIGKSNAKMRDRIQACLQEIAEHAVEFGECSLYGVLLAKVVGVDRVAIHKWIAAYGGGRLLGNEWQINKTWLEEHRNGAKSAAECLTARIEYHDNCVADPLPAWYEDANGGEDDPAVKAVWDGMEKLEALLVSFAKREKNAKGTNLGLGRHLRNALDAYKAEVAAEKAKAAEQVQA